MWWLFLFSIELCFLHTTWRHIFAKLSMNLHCCWIGLWDVLTRKVWARRNSGCSSYTKSGLTATKYILFDWPFIKLLPNAMSYCRCTWISSGIHDSFLTHNFTTMPRCKHSLVVLISFFLLTVIQKCWYFINQNAPCEAHHSCSFIFTTTIQHAAYMVWLISKEPIYRLVWLVK